MSRDQFFCGLFILAAANGLAGFVIGTITMQGWFAALLGLFGVSAIVWAACWAVTLFLYSSQPDEVIHAPDMAVGLGVLSMTILPFSKLSWLALTVLGLYMLWVSAAGSPRRRAASIALAITGPMLWGPALMDTFATPILQADAILVSNVLGTSHFGNVFSGAARKPIRDLPGVFFSSWNFHCCAGLGHDQQYARSSMVRAICCLRNPCRTLCDCRKRIAVEFDRAVSRALFCPPWVTRQRYCCVALSRFGSRNLPARCWP